MLDEKGQLKKKNQQQKLFTSVPKEQILVTNLFWHVSIFNASFQ